MSKIFLSYLADAKPDENLAVFLKSSLEDNNYAVITSPREAEDKNTIHEIKAKIGSADFFIVILSKESIESIQIQDEVKTADDLFKQSKKWPVILPIRLGDYDKLPTDLAKHLDEKEYVEWKESSRKQIVIEQILNIMQKIKKQKFKQIVRKFPVHFISVFAIVLLLFNFITHIITSLTLINPGDFIKTNGRFAFIYIWGIVPIFISTLVVILNSGRDLSKNKVKLCKLYIYTLSIFLMSLIILGLFSYKDSQKTNLTIISETTIQKIKIESRTKKRNVFELIPFREDESNYYTINKRLPYDDYNITVYFWSEQSQFITRRLKEQKETLILF